MNEKMNLEKSPYQLGLPPMELAETNDRDSNGTKKCFVHPLIRKILAIIFILFFMVGAYIFLITLLQGFDCGYFCSTEIVIVNQNAPNITIEQGNIEVFVQFKNKTESKAKRYKREVLDTSEKKDNEIFAQLDDNGIQQARDIITNHNIPCSSNNQEEVCKNLVTSIKAITEQKSTATLNNNLDEKSSLSIFKEESEISTQKKSETSTNKRETLDDIVSQEPTPKLPFESRESSRHVLIESPAAPILPAPIPIPHYPHIHGPPKIADTCLLAKLLKQNFPHALHDITEYSPPNYESHPLPYSRYQSVIPAPNLQARAVNSPRNMIHPQDMAIQMNVFATQPTERSANSSRREADCVQGNVSCDNGEKCILESQWCDGKVDCPDVSDETKCSCKSRVDKSRLCDGYFDCPFGEDEMGCYGCSESTFSCMDLDMNSQSTCFSKEQRCNNLADCPSTRDELDCTMLAPTLHNTAVTTEAMYSEGKHREETWSHWARVADYGPHSMRVGPVPLQWRLRAVLVEWGLTKADAMRNNILFSVSNTEGFLHRNFKGDWYAVCKNPYQWAHDACRRETGLIIRPPFIQVLSVDPMLKMNYLNTGEGGLLHMSNTCFNNSAIYVTCPDLLCGTRIMPAAQILKENTEAENHLFGRNKRFLVRHPYPVQFYNSRAKRHTANVTYAKDFSDINNLKNNNDNLRKKRTESRVVGGKPSLPAAWPWMIAMYRDGMFHCGGVILTQNWVISAAHCVDKYWNHYFEIRVGMLRRFSYSPQEQNYKVTHVIVNKFYNHEDMRNDLSLMKVEPSIQFSRWVRPICLPGPETAGREWLWGPPAGTMCTAVGWGATVEHGPDPDHMREVEIPVWANCKHPEDRAGKEICAGLNEGGRDACQGDSGGPLLCKNPQNPQQWYMAGIVSHGDGCGRKGEPGVYTRVSLFVKWIRYHIFSQSLPSTQPKQECQSFKCISGLAKCLASKRVCDKVVDCLGGEDEINCDTTRTPQTNENIFLSTPTQEFTNLIDANLQTKEVEINSKIMRTKEESNEVTPSFSLNTDLKSSENEQHDNINIIKEKNEQESKTFTSTEFPDVKSSNMNFTKIPNEKDTEENIFEGDGTIDPFKSDSSMERTSRGDMAESISITLPKSSLESMASMSEKSNLRDIQGEWSDELSTTNLTETSTINIVNHNFDHNITSESVVTTTTENFNKQEDTTKSIINENISGPESKDLLLDISESQTTSGLHTNEQTIPNNVNTEHQDEADAKFLSDLGNDQILDKIEGIASFKLEPAKVKRQHRVPKEFECRHINQIIPYHQRCDRKADCEDGTDELSCTCVDYLFRFDQQLLCDGIFDCADGQDEMDCYNCPENHFLCQRSQQCLPSKYVCDEKSHCPMGEDELECYTLTNGLNVEVDISGKPKVSLQGYLTKKHTKDWHVICDENLTTEQQDSTASHICRYLGFSSANRYLVKHINIKGTDILRSTSDEDSRNRRNVDDSIPVQFAFRRADDTARHIVINEPQLLKEQCVPNVTKTCMSLYVYCDHALYTENFDLTNELLYKREADVKTHMWPWVAKVYVNGDYRCSGVLVDLSWALVSHSCLWDVLLSHHHITVILGSHRTLSSNKGMFEQIYEIDAKKDMYHTKAVLLHLKEPAQYTSMVKPMIVTSNMDDVKPTICLAIGQDENNTTVGIFLEETNQNCDLHNRCFIKTLKENVCAPGVVSRQQWAGIISCHTEQGWYPVASFVDSRGECGIGDRIIGSEIGSLKNEIKHFVGRTVSESTEMFSATDCDGVRCGRGSCIKMSKVCDGVPDCEDQNDEQDDACQMKTKMCIKDPYQRGCECSSGELKCHNGKCVAKELFNDGKDDCGDGSDEPTQLTCAHYLAKVKPSRLCDGILHCKDRTDEDPMFCKCFAKKGYRCNKASSDIDLCVSHDVVCDGVNDCPGGEDEKTCLALKAPEGSIYGTGQVMRRSHGVWHTKCYQNQNHTRTELEAICRDLGFISGHAKQLVAPPNLTRPSKYIIDQFSEIMLNDNTSISLRNTDEPLAKTIVPDSMENCYPVYIECL